MLLSARVTESSAVGYRLDSLHSGAHTALPNVLIVGHQFPYHLLTPGHVGHHRLPVVPVAPFVCQVGISFRHSETAQEDLERPGLGTNSILYAVGAKSQLVKNIYAAERFPVCCMYLGLLQAVRLADKLALNHAPPGAYTLIAGVGGVTGVHEYHGLYVTVG